MKKNPRLILSWLSLIVIGVAAYALRYALVESPDVANACETSLTFECSARHVAVMGFILGRTFGYQMGIYGWVALAAAALALGWKKPFAAWLSAATGLVAVILYCFAPGAFALLIGCLRLVRLQSTGATPSDSYGNNRTVHARH